MRGIAASRTAGAPIDVDATVAAALRAFDEFIAAWVGPAAHQLAFNGEDQARVRDAILAVAKTAHRDRVIGTAVFKVSYNADESSRIEYECMTPVFQGADRPVNALAGYRERYPGRYEILAIVEPL